MIAIKANYMKFSEKMIKITMQYIKEKIENDNFSQLVAKTPNDLSKSHIH